MPKEHQVAMRKLAPLLAFAMIAVVGSTSSAQQFRFFSNLPGAAIWTEGLECADVDNDGNLDIFLANGDGFSTAGTKRQNGLAINQPLSGLFVFADESVARLGVHLSNAKQVITGDIQGDGWIDALYCNAFNTDLPFLYVNQGVSNPGFFDFDGVARGFTSFHNASDGAFGDCDNDGDLDVVLCDSGTSLLGGAGGKPALYINDGTGNFTEDVSFQSVMSNETAHMHISFVDMDNDWTLDVWGTNRNDSFYLLLNDGSGNFTDASNLIAGGSTSQYESETADLDGDTDIDAYFIGLNPIGGFGFPGEGPKYNELIGAGSLGFVNGADIGGDDDNEVVLHDYDMDGDMDAIIGSLAAREKLHENNGSGVFSDASPNITAINDSTLDCTVADLNNDGRYDLITAQGESNPSQYANKIYGNTSVVDTLAPTVAREEALTSPSLVGPWVVRAEVQDQVQDDGKDWLTAEVKYIVLENGSQASVDIIGLSYSPAVLAVSTGTRVVWTNTDVAAHTVTSTTNGYGFDSGSIAPGETYSYTFVSPGTYDYESTLDGGVTGQIVVSGTVSTGTTVLAGARMYRHEMTDTTGGLGKKLAYELCYTDWNGNFTATESHLVPLPFACGASQYDTGLGAPNILVLSAGGSTSIGNQFQAVTTNAGGSVAILTYFAFAPENYSLLGGIGLVDPFQIIFNKINGVVAGTATRNVFLPDDVSFCGLAIYMQSLGFDDTQVEDFALSNGLELIICP